MKMMDNEGGTKRNSVLHDYLPFCKQLMVQGFKDIYEREWNYCDHLYCHRDVINLCDLDLLGRIPKA